MATADEYSDLWCLKGIQPLSQFCDVQCHRTATKIISYPLHNIMSISLAVCSALFNYCDSAHIRV